jgi:hypothetical protein
MAIKSNKLRLMLWSIIILSIAVLINDLWYRSKKEPIEPHHDQPRADQQAEVIDCKTVAPERNLVT